MRGRRPEKRTPDSAASTPWRPDEATQTVLTYLSRDLGLGAAEIRRIALRLLTVAEPCRDDRRDPGR